MDGIGFGFEHYDPIGAWRDLDSGVPVDATGELVGTDVAGPFHGAVELAQKLATSEQVRDCVGDQWFRYALGRSIDEDDGCATRDLRAAFAASDLDLRELMLALVATKSFRALRIAD
jgi:hypothetical protein